ncbi:DUF1772 domain-containing protein [filamentous cyanobacterium CCT1]|nr:DUF1772 domain-containing protein [filamentous cyanobacterium CCT1]PSN81509.1 DUF1772 domain-containing protein [filamentous cyanobacterium CCP4]
MWLFVINLGIALGAGLYEAQILFPQWLVTLPGSGYEWQAAAAREANVGLRFWVYVTTIPLTLLTLANAIAASRRRGTLRRWWFAAVGLAVMDRAATFSYFVPTMLALMEGNLAQAQAVEIALQWEHLNVFRHLVVLLAWLAALKTFSLIYQQDA